MSAFLVSKRHIDVLVAADPNRDEWRPAIGNRLGTADKLGRMLFRANECPWCGVRAIGPHRADCPAFTPDGDVR